MDNKGQNLSECIGNGGRVRVIATSDDLKEIGCALEYGDAVPRCPTCCAATLLNVTAA
jgi:hypothetical protein